MLVLKPIVFCLTALVLSYHPLKVFQLCGYRVREWLTFLFSRPLRSAIYLVLVVFGLLSQLLFPPLLWGLSGFAALFGIGCAVAKRKTPLKLTKRISRFLSVFASLLIALSVPCAFYPCFCACFVFPFVGIPLASLLVLPVEKAICAQYEKQAKRKLERIQPIVIAVTGSYGKTTFKKVLAQILSTKYRVCASPASYNTPQGLALTVNQHLKDTDEILIVEFGARYRGDIKRLCALIPPDYAVLTAVGNQHLQTFRTLEALREEKFSIFSHCKRIGFFNGDDSQVRLLYERYPKAKTISGKTGDVAYEAVRSGDTISFAVRSGETVVPMTCPLATPYLPSTIALALSVAFALDVPISLCQQAVSSLKAVAHRLELVYNGNDVILDDAYNANEHGFRAAVDLLARQSGKIKILVTPGVVELGKRQFAVNRDLAAYASERADQILTYGPNAKAIAAGGGNKVKVFGSLKGCMTYYKTIQGERAVLFENDLPDAY